MDEWWKLAWARLAYLKAYRPPFRLNHRLPYLQAPLDSVSRLVAFALRYTPLPLQFQRAEHRLVTEWAELHRGSLLAFGVRASTRSLIPKVRGTR